MKVKKDDIVKIKSGKDKGKQGKVMQTFPNEGKVVVENININKRHLRPQKQGEAGQVVEFSAAFDVSKVQLVCPKCGKVTRIGHTLSDDKKKTRICKKCKSSI